MIFPGNDRNFNILSNLMVIYRKDRQPIYCIEYTIY